MSVLVDRIDSAWPTEPFAEIDGVREASGDPTQLARLVRDAHVLVTHLAPVTRTVLDAGSASLRVVGVTRGGPVNVDLAAATGIPVLRLPGRNLGAVAEYRVGTMICAMRGLPGAATLSAGYWDGTGFRNYRVGIELRAATVGLIGLGAIGLRVAELLAAFGTTVIAHDPYADARLAQQARGTAPWTRRWRPGTYAPPCSTCSTPSHPARARRCPADRMSSPPHIWPAHPGRSPRSPRRRSPTRSARYFSAVRLRTAPTKQCGRRSEDRESGSALRAGAHVTREGRAGGEIDPRDARPRLARRVYRSLAVKRRPVSTSQA